MHFRTIRNILIIAAISAVLSGCGSPGFKIAGNTAEMEGVTVTLTAVSARREKNPDRYEYAFSGTIENNSEEGIMTVTYTFSLYDKNGEEFHSFGIVYDGENEAIPPHGRVGFSHEGIKWGAQDVPKSVSIGISSVQRESELPPGKLPEEGEYLYKALGDGQLAGIKEEPPAEMAFHVDQGGYGRTAVFESGPLLDKASELLCGIRIGKETEEAVTDNYNWIRLTWKDGTETYIGLNRRNLEYTLHSRTHIYELDGLGAFWSYAEEYLKEDGAEGGS